jgi:hypothetical protein
MNNSVIPKSILFLFPFNLWSKQSKTKQNNKQTNKIPEKAHPLHSLSEMQIKLPKEEWAERKLPDVGVLPNFYVNELHAEIQKNIMLETQKLTQKPTRYSWQEYI